RRAQAGISGELDLSARNICQMGRTQKRAGAPQRSRSGVQDWPRKIRWRALGCFVGGLGPALERDTGPDLSVRMMTPVRLCSVVLKSGRGLPHSKTLRE